MKIFFHFLLECLLIHVSISTRDYLPRRMDGKEYSRTYHTVSKRYDNYQTSCKSEADCSYNGKCVNNYCQCRPQWFGPYCGVLNLLKTNKSYGLQYEINGERVSSWGGAVITDSSGDYHMYSAEMSMYCGINVWQPNSIIVHSKSTKNKNGIASYQRLEEIDDIFSHEPDVIKAPTGEFVIYYSHVYPPPTGTEKIDPCSDCNDGITGNCDAQMVERDPYIIYTYMIYSKSPTGPWSSPQIIPSDIGIDSNLAGYIYPNGSFIGIFRGWGDIKGIRAKNWKDNNTYEVYDTYLDPPNIGEDPYMYMDCNNILHTIWHGGGWDSPWGYHRYSNDNGNSWIGYDYDIQTYNNTVYFNDGDIYHYQRMERPHLIFDNNDGCTPIALTNGAELGSINQVFYPDYTYTLLRPINQN